MSEESSSLSEQPWVEKYRPHTLNDVVGQSEIVKRLKVFVHDNAMPHLLFAGPAGTGKTTCAMALIRDMLKSAAKRNVTFLELNASDARGIDVIRTDVKDFAKAQAPPGIPFKILVLDEADSIDRCGSTDSSFGQWSDSPRIAVLFYVVIIQIKLFFLFKVVAVCSGFHL